MKVGTILIAYLTTESTEKKNPNILDLYPPPNQQNKFHSG